MSVAMNVGVDGFMIFSWSLDGDDDDDYDDDANGCTTVMG